MMSRNDFNLYRVDLYRIDCLGRGGGGGFQGGEKITLSRHKTIRDTEAIYLIGKGRD